jgi:hypothetical protein
MEKRIVESFCHLQLIDNNEVIYKAYNHPDIKPIMKDSIATIVIIGQLSNDDFLYLLPSKFND